mmetsp:Transcript_15237/g.13348  ORF Transcript_15237/g.13348 Transcript_15237/m.13348 type:complete len:108 (+) Transcript_15237:14-337(+)
MERKRTKISEHKEIQMKNNISPKERSRIHRQRKNEYYKFLEKENKQFKEENKQLKVENKLLNSQIKNLKTTYNTSSISESLITNSQNNNCLYTKLKREEDFRFKTIP